MTKDLIIKLRSELHVPIMTAKKALIEAGGDYDKAKQILKIKAQDMVIEKADRKTKAGRIEAYVHGDGQIGVLVEVQVETDFVARGEEFKSLVHDLCLQIAAMSPKDVKELLASPYIKDESITVQDLITNLVAKIGENVKVVRFEKYVLGELN